MGVSLRDIALRAGVSVATVSNVVNGYRPVAAATKVRVQEAIDEMGYSPNLSARHLRRGRTGFIALAIPELNNPYFAELADVAIAEAARHGYTVLLDSTNGERERELEVVHGLRAQIVDGLIFSPAQLGPSDLADRRDSVPLVLVGERIHDVAYDHISIDNIAASRVAVEHLASLGRRRIAFVGAQDSDRQPAGLRLQGYTEGVHAAGLTVDPRLVVRTPGFDRADGADGVAPLLRGSDPPDAVFAYNDLIAVGVMRTAYEMGLRVPDDLAVVGFDDINEARFTTPSLTTIAPDKEVIGKLAVTALVSRLEGENKVPREYEVPFRLVVRESTVGAALPEEEPGG